ncbi:MAG: hypothetical protein JWO50_875 [Candidatus Kaiserbacteria bacterium]|nr:hypothetical protein [Candidatus Kaiserbacteria bacterium]
MKGCTDTVGVRASSGRAKPVSPERSGPSWSDPVLGRIADVRLALPNATAAAATKSSRALSAKEISYSCVMTNGAGARAECDLDPQ